MAGGVRFTAYMLYLCAEMNDSIKPMKETQLRSGIAAKIDLVLGNVSKPNAVGAWLITGGCFGAAPKFLMDICLCVMV